MLSVKGIVCFYADLEVFWGVSSQFDEKTTTGIIGSNRAGKTTLLNSIVCLTKAKSGFLFFQVERIDHLRSYQIANTGVSMLHEGQQFFPSMTF